jgi:hypothetical protein
MGIVVLKKQAIANTGIYLLLSITNGPYFMFIADK